MPIMQTVIQGGGTTPTGTRQITNNGTYDVTDYANAEVNVPTTAPDYYVEYSLVQGKLSRGSATPFNLYNISAVNNYAFYYGFSNSVKSGVGFTNSESLKIVSANNAFQNCFYQCSQLTSTGLNIEEVTGSYAFEYFCSYCTNLTDTGLSHLKYVNSGNAFHRAFQNCTHLTSTGLNNLISIRGNSNFDEGFINCTALQSTGLDNLREVVGQNVLYDCFKNCTNIPTATFPKLVLINGDYALGNMFANCHLTDLYFPVFDGSQSSSGSKIFGSDNGSLLKDTSGCTVHFHKSQQNVIGSWQSITGGLGGTNTTILFDQGVTATVSVPTGYTVYVNGTDVTNASTYDFFEGDNEIVSVSSDGKVGKYIFTATSSTTAFVFDPTQITYNEFTCTSNVAGATYSAQASTTWLKITATPDANDKIYCSAGFDLTVSGTASNYYADPVTTTSATSGTITLTFIPATIETYDTTNFLSSITGDTTYASVDTANNQLLYHYPTNASWAGSVQIALNVPAGTTKIRIVTRAYVSSEQNYDFGYFALGTARANPQPNYSAVKNGTITNGVYLFRQSGTSNLMTNIDYETTDTTQNVLTVGWAQDSSLSGTNTLYIEPITVIYLQ